MKFLYLQINHVSWKRDLWVLPCVYNRYVSLFDFLLNKSLKRKKKNMIKQRKQSQKQKRRETVFLNIFPLNLTRTVSAMIFSSLCQQCSLNNSLSLRSISSHRRTSFTNFLWNTFTSGFNCNSMKEKRSLT